MWLLTLSCLLIIAILVCIILLILVCIIWVIIGYIIVIISWSSVRIWGTIIRVIICVLIRIRFFVFVTIRFFVFVIFGLRTIFFIWVFLTLIRYFWSSLLLSLWLFRAIPPNIAIAPRIRMAAISGNKIFMKPPFSYLLIGHCTDCFD